MIWVIQPLSSQRSRSPIGVAQLLTVRPPYTFMITASYSFDGDSIRRKYMEAAEAEVRDILFRAGIHNVTARAVAIEDSGVRFEFSGEPADIEKAKAVLPHQT
jgi:hypothetical protein